MIGYIAARARETSTWVSLGIFVACVLIFWYYRGQIYTHAVATVALFKAATRDGIEQRTIAWLKTRFTKAPVVATVQQPKEIHMSDTIVKTLESAALAAFKSVPLPAPYGTLVSAVISAAENPTTVNVLAVLADVITIAQALEATPVPAASEETAA